MEQLREQLRQEYESAHSQQVTLLRGQFEEECRTMTEGTRREMEKRHSDEVNRLVMQHEQEISRLRQAIDISKCYGNVS